MMQKYLGFFLIVMGLLVLVRQAGMVTAVTATPAALPETQLQLLKDANPGSASGYPADFATLNGILYYSADDGVHGFELWRSDGSPTGTTMIADINPGSAYSNPYGIVPFGGYYHDSVIYFIADSGSGNQIWKSDGTTGGTMPATDPLLNPTKLTVVGDTLYFFADDPLYGTELWANNGTIGGSWLVKDINPGSASSYVTQTPVALGNKLLFIANDGTHGSELWVSDGTLAGTTLLKDINPDQSGAGIIGDFVVWGGLAYFPGNDGQFGGEVWQSDGTPAGTVRVVGSTGSSVGVPAQLLGVSGGLLYFLSNAPAKLWTTDSTGTNVNMVYDFSAEVTSGYLSGNAVPFQNGFCFQYTGSSIHGSFSNIWCGDSVTATQIDVYSYSYDDVATDLAALNGVLYFGARDGAAGVELWQSDGTAAGSRLVQDIQPGFTDSTPVRLITAENRIFFSADDGTHGRELWLLTEQSSWQVYLPFVIR